jgi:hypothetical protein
MWWGSVSISIFFFFFNWLNSICSHPFQIKSNFEWLPTKSNDFSQVNSKYGMLMFCVRKLLFASRIVCYFFGRSEAAVYGLCLVLLQGSLLGYLVWFLPFHQLRAQIGVTCSVAICLLASLTRWIPAISGVNSIYWMITFLVLLVPICAATVFAVMFRLRMIQIFLKSESSLSSYQSEDFSNFFSLFLS